jgi:membrane protein DedA with SNARE-associated domain
VGRVFSGLVEYSYLFVLLATAIDATAFPFPGRLVLVAAGVLAAADRVNLIGTLAAGIAGTVAGDHLWYFGGRWSGGRLASLYRRLARRSTRSPADPAAYVRRYGAFTIVLGRFLAVVRVLAWPVASAHGVGYGRFVAWELAAATLWVGAFVLVGFLAGRPALAIVERWGGSVLAIAGGLAALLAIAVLVRRRRRGRRPSSVRRAGVRRPRQ